MIISMDFFTSNPIIFWTYFKVFSYIILKNKKKILKLHNFIYFIEESSPYDNSFFSILGHSQECVNRT